MKWLLGIPLLVWMAWWAIASPTYTLRWKLTVEVDTPRGIQSASSVLESSFFGTSGVVGGASAELRGQAVFLDLGEGKNVIALMARGTSDQAGDAFKALPVTALTGAGWGWGAYQELKRRNGNLTGRTQLSLENVPVLLSFFDLSDPTTARVIDMSNSAFTSAFGPGYAFRSATVDIIPRTIWSFNPVWDTREPITQGIEENFPWWIKQAPWSVKTKAGEPYFHTQPQDQFRWNPAHIKREIR